MSHHQPHQQSGSAQSALDQPPTSSAIIQPKQLDSQPQSSTVDSGFLSSDSLTFASEELQAAEEFASSQRPGLPAAAAAAAMEPAVPLGKTHAQSTTTTTTTTFMDSGLCADAEEELEEEAEDVKLPGKPNGEPDEIYANEMVMRECMPHTKVPVPLWKVCYTQDSRGDTKLHASIASNESGALTTAITRMIQLAPRADLYDLRNDAGHTGLHAAVATGQPHIIRHLRVAGAKPDVRDHRGNTALHLACLNADLRSVRALTERLGATERRQMFPEYAQRIPLLPADTNVLNYDGKTCIHIAATLGQLDILRQLATCAAADLNGRETCAGYTALHCALRAHRTDVLDMLLTECLPQLQLETSSYGRLTAHQLAVQMGNLPAAAALRRAGARPLQPPLDDSSDSEDEEVDSEDEDSGDEQMPEGDQRRNIFPSPAEAELSSEENALYSSCDDNGAIFYVSGSQNDVPMQ